MTKEEFTKFYYQEIDKVFRFFFLRVKTLEEAQDLTSLLFLKFYEFFFNNKNQTKIKDERAFLYKMAKNLLIDFYRNKNKLPYSLDQLLKEKGFEAPSSFNLEEKIELNWELERIKKALKEIKPIYAEVIILHYINDYSIKEISQILNKSENNIRVILFRALNSLKKKLTDKEKV